MTYPRTIEDAKQVNEDNGYYFLSPDTLKFFDTKIESDIIKDQYFIINDAAGFRDRRPGGRREYKVCKVDWETGQIDYVKRGFDDLEDAEVFVENL